jgi:hypothetical protein
MQTIGGGAVQVVHTAAAEAEGDPELASCFSTSNELEKPEVARHTADAELNMDVTAIIFESFDDVRRRLATLGLSPELLREAILDGEAARESCTPHDPSSLPGILAWGRTVRGLRDRLVPVGWTSRDVQNYPTVVSPDGMLAVAVATGDEGTGRPEFTASTKYAKGSATALAVTVNQLDLFPSPAAFWTTPATVTWILLVRRDSDVVRAELSRPKLITEDGVIVDWSERVILGEIPVEPEPLADSCALNEDIVVEVARKKA